MNYGAKLKEVRKARGLSLLDVQKKIGVDKSTLSKWENGKRELMLDSFVKLIKLYQVDPKVVIYDYDNPTRRKNL